MTAKDFLGKPIHVGDTVVFNVEPLRHEAGGGFVRGVVSMMSEYNVTLTTSVETCNGKIDFRTFRPHNQVIVIAKAKRPAKDKPNVGDYDVV